MLKLLRRLFLWPPQGLLESVRSAGTEGRFKRVHQGLLYFAEVAVTVDPAPHDSYIQVDGTGGHRGAGDEPEDWLGFGHEPWKDGAVAGVRYALRVAGRPNSGVVIHRVTGRWTDTTPSIVAAAAADAVWKSLGFTPAAEDVQELESLAFDSFNNPRDALPNLRGSNTG